jgi:hypothetical protein
MRRRFRTLAILAVVGLASGILQAADPRLDAVDARLERIFAKKEFEPKKFGPYRWNQDGRVGRGWRQGHRPLRPRDGQSQSPRRRVGTRRGAGFEAPRDRGL